MRGIAEWLPEKLSLINKENFGEALISGAVRWG
jgi:hypothetical protein